MRVTQYSTIMDDDKICHLVKEKSINYACLDNINHPGMINKMMRDIYQIDRLPEEHAYILCLNQKRKLQGIFEISHGTFNFTLCDPREVFQKALLCNAARIVLCHNHPSGDCTPSREDEKTYNNLKEAGKLMSIPIDDSIIIGENFRYFSFYEHGEQ